MYPDHDRLFVVRAVEDADHAPLRQGLGGAPEIIVIQFLGRRRLEAGYVAALRVDADMTCLMAPSFPAASRAWKISSSA